MSERGSLTPRALKFSKAANSFKVVWGLIHVATVCLRSRTQIKSSQSMLARRQPFLGRKPKEFKICRSHFVQREK